MAAVVNGNTVYIVVGDTDTTALDDKNIQVVGIIASSTAGGTIVLGDNISGASYPIKLTLDIPVTGFTYMDLSNTPVVFPNGIRVKAVTGTPFVTLLFRRP